MRPSMYPVNTGRIVFFICCLFNCALFCSCQNKEKKYNFYYSNNSKIELIIPGDTLGIVLNLQPHTMDSLQATKIRQQAYAKLNKLGYKLVDTLENEILLLTGKNQNKKRSSLEEEFLSLKSNPDNDFIKFGGYLARIKESNAPVILTNEIIIQFKPGSTEQEINQLFRKYNLEIKSKNPFTERKYTVAVTKNSQFDALRTSHELREEPNVRYAQINMVYIKKLTSFIPNDHFFDRQWTMLNAGSTDAIEDADVDADQAWQLTRGSPNTIIAVIDNGVDVLHNDLAEGFFHNAGDTPRNNIDDDRNTLVDDTIGWDFKWNTNNLLMAGDHGTAVIGIAGARGNNNLGISGMCPECKILPIVMGTINTTEMDGRAFEYAISRGAKIINCSWTLNEVPITDDLAAIIADANEAGVTIVCAMENTKHNHCERLPDLTSLPTTIAVSSSTCLDIYNEYGYGDCMDLLAPSAGQDNTRGALRISTTDITGERGYSSSNGDRFCTTATDLDYTHCFGGNSAAAPLIAGIAGLILSADHELTPLQIRYLLQDCADKIDTSNGHYSRKNGFSNYDDPDSAATHGYGRVNAFESVRIATPVAGGGLGGVDIFLRDNILDWGNTEQPSNVLFDGNPRGTIGHWRSQDIKVDAPNGVGIAPLNSIDFERFEDEQPIANQVNKVYVRVHNRGYKKAANVDVKLYWIHGGTMLPPLWNHFPQDVTISNPDPNWHFLGTVSLKDLQYSGASVAYTTEDNSQIATFDFPAPVPTPGQRNHYCLAALIDSPDDPLNVPALAGITSLDEATPRFNNITHRNYSIISSSGPTATSNQIMINNPFAYSVETKITLINPNNIITHINNVYVDCLFVMQPKESKVMNISFDQAGINYPAEITVQQEFVLPGQNKKKRVFGGFTFHFIQ